MRQGPNPKRSRGRNNGRRPNMPLRMQTFDSNGPDVRIRGSAYQVHEKYLQLARDASSSGDRIMAENYLQHAEHYYRIIAVVQEQQAANDPNGGNRQYRPDGQGYGQDYRGGQGGDDMGGDGGDEPGDGQQPHAEQAYRQQSDGGYRQQPDGGGQYRQQNDGYGRSRDEGQYRQEGERGHRGQNDRARNDGEGGGRGRDYEERREPNPNQGERTRRWDLNGSANEEGVPPAAEPVVEMIAQVAAPVDAAPAPAPRRGRPPRRERPQPAALPGIDPEPAADG